MIYGELGLFSIEIDVKLRMISYWARLLTGKETNSNSYPIQFCITFLLMKIWIVRGLNMLNTFLMIQAIPTFGRNNSFKIPTCF
jgi:hypothetical protein